MSQSEEESLTIRVVNCRKAYLTRDEADEGDDDQRQSLPNRRHDIRVFKIFRKECKNEHFFFAGKKTSSSPRKRMEKRRVHLAKKDTCMIFLQKKL